MITSIKVETETKERLLKLDLAEKGKSFNIMLNELISFYERNNKEHQKAMKEYKDQVQEYKKSMKKYKDIVKTTEDEQETWKKLMKWAKTKGFKE